MPIQFKKDLELRDMLSDHFRFFPKNAWPCVQQGSEGPAYGEPPRCVVFSFQPVRTECG